MIHNAGATGTEYEHEHEHEHDSSSIKDIGGNKDGGSVFFEASANSLSNGSVSMESVDEHKDGEDEYGDDYLSLDRDAEETDSWTET